MVFVKLSALMNPVFTLSTAVCTGTFEVTTGVIIFEMMGMVVVAPIFTRGTVLGVSFETGAVTDVGVEVIGVMTVLAYGFVI